MTQLATVAPGSIPGAIPPTQQYANPGLPQSTGFYPGSNWGTIMALVGQAQTLVQQLAGVMQGQLGSNVLAGGQQQPTVMPQAGPMGGGPQACCAQGQLSGMSPLAMPSSMMDADPAADPIPAADPAVGSDPLAGLTESADPLAAPTDLGDDDVAASEPDASSDGPAAPPADMADGDEDASARNAIAEAEEAARPQAIPSGSEGGGGAENEAPAVDLANTVVANAQEAESSEAADSAGAAPAASAEEADAAAAAPPMNTEEYETQEGDSLFTIIQSLVEQDGATPQQAYDALVAANAEDPRLAELFGDKADLDSLTKPLAPGTVLKLPVAGEPSAEGEAAPATAEAAPESMSDADGAAPAAADAGAATGPSPEAFLAYLEQNPEVLKRFAAMLQDAQAA